MKGRGCREAGQTTLGFHQDEAERLGLAGDAPYSGASSVPSSIPTTILHCLQCHRSAPSGEGSISSMVLVANPQTDLTWRLPPSSGGYACQ
jgi:hypothetical protein